MMKSGFTSLSQVVEAYYDELRHFIRKRTDSPSMAEDVVQETWIRAKATTAGFPDNPRAYVYRMAGNVAVDHMRRQQAWDRLRCMDDEGRVDDPGMQLAQLPCTMPEPLEVVISQRELAALNAALCELPCKCREVFLLYRGNGLSMREVAARLSITEKTVEKHIARAMVHCRARMREAGRNV